jgi:CRP-like cAMP-binding protein/glyoxylase-like metal-dependent hydrolase (beta-lactamase superfamily II)
MADVVELSRGGLWVNTPAGPVQLGAPAETIKDTLQREGGVPRTILLPHTLVDVRRGRSIADLEFPIYFNLFAKKRPLVVIGSAANEARIKAAVQESLLGPAKLDLNDDVVEGVRPPDLVREHGYFRKGPFKNGLLTLDDAIDFRATDAGPIDLGEGVFVERSSGDVNDGWVVRWADERVHLPAQPPPLPSKTSSTSSRPPFVPPRFGVTVLGRSHGFDPDPNERTSGFVMWCGGKGIMVDPPVRSTEILAAADVDLKLIDGILLTHCHADHDAGTLEKAVEAGRVTLYTTPTIFRSYQRKWSALSGIPAAELEKLFDFRPVRIGAPVDIHGAKFLFRFTLHSIPTIAFEVHLDGRSFNYSSDHLNDPRQIEAIFAAGHMERERREELLHFNWSHDLVFHEAGVPPLHTPLDVLEQLPVDVRKRVYVLHTTPSRLSPTSGLKLAPAGTIDMKVEATPVSRVLRNLALLGGARLFSTLPLERAAELLAGAREVRIKAGERFIADGDDLSGQGGDMLYVVTGGRASVRRGGRELKVYSLGDYIGETAVFLGSVRTADVVALTDLELLAVDGQCARRACDGTEIPALVKRHAKVREMDAWSLLEESELFAGLTATQKNELETLLHPIELRAGAPIVKHATRAKDLVIVHSGLVDVTGVAEGSSVGRGGVVGDAAALLSGALQPTGGTAKTAMKGFRIKKNDLAWFLDKNPSIKVRIQPWSAPDDHSSPAASSLMQMLEDYL